jgi:Inner membrane component of T3SS, cytoplasmic domain
VADEKKPPAFDPDKTVVDVRRPQPPREDERTIVAPRSGAEAPPPPPEESADRTVVMSRRPAAAEDADRTRVATRPPASTGGAADRTMVTPVGAPAPAATAGAGFFLVVLSDPQRGQRFSLGPGEVSIGSDPSCQIRLATAEPKQAKLRREGDGYELECTGSSGSVITHGRAVTKGKLRPGDLIKVGGHVLRFVRVGDVFSSEYSEAEFESEGVGRFLDPDYLRERPLMTAVVAAAIVAIVVVVFWPKSSTPPPPPIGETSNKSADHAQEVSALLLSGEVLFNQGKYVAPPDRPEEDNAYTQFNQALALDPGNEKVRDWLKRIDGKLDEARRQRQEEERRRQEAVAAAQAKARAELAKKVEAVLAGGDQLFEAGKVVEPAGDNALVRYRSALKLDPESVEAQARIRRAIYTMVDQGDKYRDQRDTWRALEQYRKADRAAEHKDPEITARLEETERVLKSGMAGTLTRIVMYKDDAGQLYVLDEMDKVPARYRDRAVEISPKANPTSQ